MASSRDCSPAEIARKKKRFLKSSTSGKRPRTNLHNTAEVRARIAELQAEVEQRLQAERDGQRYSMTRRGMVDLLIEIITSPPKKASLHKPLCEVR